MIRVIMLGRLGNNLFQYALGRVLSEKHGVPLCLDASWYNHRTWRYVEPIRRLPGITSGKAQVVRPFSMASRLLAKLTGKHHWEYIGVPIIRERENDHSFDSSLLHSPANSVIFGYFQSHLYFNNLSDPLRSELSMDHLGLEYGYQDLARRLKEPHSVAVHVRRTDYIGNPNLASCGLKYYQLAMEWMRTRVNHPRFHIFSDDPKWCHENFRACDVEISGCGDPFEPLIDLRLMSLASHHIIANSSYSWWAAWLGKKEGQQVAIPNKWFHGGITAPVAEKCPEGWHIVESGNI